MRDFVISKNRRTVQMLAGHEILACCRNDLNSCIFLFSAPCARGSCCQSTRCPVDSEDFDRNVERLTGKYVRLWSETRADMPGFERRFTTRQKEAHQEEVERLFSRTSFSLEKYEQLDEAERANLRRRVRTLVATMLSRAGSAVPPHSIDASERTTDEFIQKAREFDPSVKEGDVHQALRNLWVFNSIQVYLGRRVSLTPSSFAYSLLYPYTDNWLDADEHTAEFKKAFLGWLEDRIQGLHPERKDGNWDIHSRLLQMIEGEFPRELFPDVFRSLLAIHAAQRKSLLLHRPPTEAGEEDLLPLTVAKGGTSVLADGFMVSGVLETAEVDALFGYGVLLQLIDDLHDVDEDMTAGHSTPFSRAAGKERLDGITNRLFSFSRPIVGVLKERPAIQEGHFGDFIEESVTTFILEAVARHHTLYGADYLSVIEDFSPLRLSYFGALRRRLQGRGE
jgi:hypothetical protein